MGIEVNPFGFNKPVSEHSNFIGRRDVARELLRSVLHGSSVSVIGMPKVGSSSLLKCLFLPDMAAEFEVSLDAFLPVYVNLHALPTANPRQLFDSILTTLEEQASELVQEDSVGHPSMAPFAAEFPEQVGRFQSLRRRGVTPVVLLDELDYAVTSPNMDLSLFKLMLFLQESSLALFVTSSHRPYVDIEDRIRVRDDLDDDLGSRAVAFNELTLLPFTQEEAAEFLNRLPQQLRSNEQLTSMLLAISGGHPYLLQLACFHAVEQHRQLERIDPRPLWRMFYQRAEPFFELLWNSTTKEAKRTLLKMDEAALKRFGLPDSWGNQESPLSSYTSFRYTGGGMLMGSGKDSKTFSYAFGQYVLSKRADTQSGDHDRYLLSQLRLLFAKHFDLEQLRSLCLDIGVDYENLAGQTKEGKVRELVSEAARGGFIKELIEAGMERRPRVRWPK